jgi:hypothetical protein
MESDKSTGDEKVDLFVRYSEEINRAYERAVREALLMHKRAGNPVAVERDGKLVILQPDEIPTDLDT